MIRSRVVQLQDGEGNIRLEMSESMHSFRAVFPGVFPSKDRQDEGARPANLPGGT